MDVINLLKRKMGMYRERNKEVPKRGRNNKRYRI